MLMNNWGEPLTTEFYVFHGILYITKKIAIDN